MVERDPVFDKAKYFTGRAGSSAGTGKRRVIVAEDAARCRRWSVLRRAVHDLGTDLQTLMFIPNIRATFSEAQQKQWLKAAETWNIVGAYAQTELGRSNIRALETTATFLPETDEIEIHSPSLTSTKWWPGNLGRCANHAIVYARLLVGGRDLGIHNFMVPLRDLNSHLPLSGISIGDIGPKIGYNNQDNGYCRFNRVRIPRTNMAMKYATLSRDGKYTAAKKRKQASYSTMTLVRASIVIESGKALSAATTIAVRYSAVRKQGFSGRGDGSEICVLDYPMQQARLFLFLPARSHFPSWA